jgi:pilus assembly protein CpaD
MNGTDKAALAGRPALRLAAALCFALLLGACNRTTAVVENDSYPLDYRERHPIALHEGDRTVEIFVGRLRGGLTPVQRADVLAFAQNWRHEATSGIIIHTPQGGSVGRSAAESMREVHAILAASGVPPRAIAVRPYHPDPSELASIRISYGKLTAEAGPCGLWPKDIGVSIESDHNSNRPYWNFGCASQRNFAAMVANPADLVQPRGESPNYAMRRTAVIGKYRNGDSPSGKYDDYNKGSVSDLAKQ